MIGDSRLKFDMGQARRQFAILNWVFKVGSLTLGK